MKTQIGINIGMILLMLASFVTIPYINPNTGESMDSTHYCESIGIKMYCAKTTEYYCYPSLETRTGSKKCSEGWKEIPTVPEPVNNQLKYTISTNRVICDKDGCE